MENTNERSASHSNETRLVLTYVSLVSVQPYHIDNNDFILNLVMIGACCRRSFFHEHVDSGRAPRPLHGWGHRVFGIHCKKNHKALCVAGENQFLSDFVSRVQHDDSNLSSRLAVHAPLRNLMRVSTWTAPVTRWPINSRSPPSQRPPPRVQWISDCVTVFPASYSFVQSKTKKILHICSCVSPECRQKTVDLVFLFDGSLSMALHFDRSKDIMVDVMNSFSNTSVRVSAPLQYQRFHKIYTYCIYDK